jgi:folylpolyglutamate synthase
MSAHTYQEAVEKLNSLQSNAATLEAVRASGGRLSQFAIPEMLEYLGRIGYSVKFLPFRSELVHEYTSSQTN